METIGETDAISCCGREGQYQLLRLSPDVPVCVATGDTIEETIEQMQKALKMHLEAMMQDHEPLPHPYSVLAVNIEVPETVLI